MNDIGDIVLIKEYKKKSNSLVKSVEVIKESFSKAIHTPQTEVDKTLKNIKKSHKNRIKNKNESNKFLFSSVDRKNSISSNVNDAEVDYIVPRNIGQSKILIYENNIKGENSKTIETKVNNNTGKIVQNKNLSTSNSRTLLEAKIKNKNLPKILTKKVTNTSNERYNSYNKVNSSSNEKNSSKSYKEEVSKLEKIEKAENIDDKNDKSTLNNLNKFSIIKNKYKSSLPLINEKNVNINENKKNLKKLNLYENIAPKKNVVNNTDSGITSKEKHNSDVLKKSFYNDKNKSNLSQSVKLNPDTDKIKQYFQNEYSKYCSNGETNNIKIIKNKKDLNKSTKISLEKKQNNNHNSFNNKENTTSLDPIYTVRIFHI